MKKTLYKDEPLQEQAPLLEVPYRDEKLKIQKAFIKNEVTWVPITLNELKRFTIGELVDNLTHIMLEVKIGAQKYYVVNTDEDWLSVKKKYPASPVIHITQVIRLWTTAVNGEFLSGTGPTLLMAIEAMPDAKVHKVLALPPDL